MKSGVQKSAMHTAVAPVCLRTERACIFHEFNEEFNCSCKLLYELSSLCMNVIPLRARESALLCVCDILINFHVYIYARARFMYSFDIHKINSMRPSVILPVFCKNHLEQRRLLGIFFVLIYSQTRL